MLAKRAAEAQSSNTEAIEESVLPSPFFPLLKKTNPRLIGVCAFVCGCVRCARVMYIPFWNVVVVVEQGSKTRRCRLTMY